MSRVSTLGKVRVYIKAKTDRAVRLAAGPEGGILNVEWVPRALLSTVSDRKVDAWKNTHEDKSTRFELQIEQFKLDELDWEYET